MDIDTVRRRGVSLRTLATILKSLRLISELQDKAWSWMEDLGVELGVDRYRDLHCCVQRFGCVYEGLCVENTLRSKAQFSFGLKGAQNKE